ncbi:MAG: FAD:protein FMN transferase [Candidatus Aminicenantes bacterium]|nr:FAD:protein FMN transferase [Candidatus Aminicenantes bacterium]
MAQDLQAVDRFTHHAMATLFEVMVGGHEEEYSGQAARAVFMEIDRIERLFNRFDPSSEISRINRLEPGQKLAVGVETFECLALAEEARRATAGAFDINARALVKYKGRETPPSLDLVRTSRGFEARLPDAEAGGPSLLDLDLGGIGKGYALDRVLEVLADWSVENALIHGGTSTAIAIGTAPGACDPKRGWPVGVGGKWLCPGIPDSFRLRGRALSGSGTEVKGTHVLDPRTGLPAGGHLAAWASHPAAAVADALSTAFMVMTTEDVAAYCERHPEVWALVVKDYGDCRLFNGAVALECE